LIQRFICRDDELWGCEAAGPFCLMEDGVGVGEEEDVFESANLSGSWGARDEGDVQVGLDADGFG